MTRVLLQVAQTKAEKYNVGKSLKDDDIQETKAKKENTSKDFVCNKYLSCMKKVYLTMFKSVTFSLMVASHFFVRHKLELFKCENCENLF